MVDAWRMIDNVVQFGQAQRVTVLPIPDREIDDYIDRGMELLAPAIKRVEHNVDLDDVREDILTGTSILWLVYLEDKLTAAITTCVVKHPQRKNLKIEFMGGKHMHVWMKLNLVWSCESNLMCTITTTKNICHWNKNHARSVFMHVCVVA